MTLALFAPWRRKQIRFLFNLKGWLSSVVDGNLFLFFVHRVAVGVLPTFLRFVYFLPTDLPQAVTPHGSSVMVWVALLVQSLLVESVCNTLQRFDWPINWSVAMLHAASSIRKLQKVGAGKSLITFMNVWMGKLTSNWIKRHHRNSVLKTEIETWLMDRNVPFSADSSTARSD